MKIVGIIPARYGSTRFPGKPLVEIGGRSMVVRVAEQARKCSALADILVATDDERILEHVQSHGIPAIMTSSEHPSGTDRCLEALDRSGLVADAVLNIQGDEPFVDPRQLYALCELISRTGVEIATLAKRIDDSAVLEDPNKVKVVKAPDGRALYFSRQVIPFLRQYPRATWLQHHAFFKHLGLYAYRAGVLREIAALGPSPLEVAESLEQLRWLEAGKVIYIAETDIETPAIDTPEDLARLVFPS